MKAYRHLVKYALDRGCTVSVWDGEVWEVKRSTKFKEVTDCIESVEEAEIAIRDADGKRCGWALVSAYGLQDDEMVIDCSDNDFMNGWSDAYERGL